MKIKPKMNKRFALTKNLNFYIILKNCDKLYSAIELLFFFLHKKTAVPNTKSQWPIKSLNLTEKLNEFLLVLFLK